MSPKREGREPNIIGSPWTFLLQTDSTQTLTYQRKHTATFTCPKPNEKFIAGTEEPAQTSADPAHSSDCTKKSSTAQASSFHHVHQ